MVQVTDKSLDGNSPLLSSSTRIIFGFNANVEHAVASYPAEKRLVRLLLYLS